MKKLELVVAHLESDASYSGGLGQYNVGIGKVIGPVIVQQDPPSQLSNDQIAKTLITWTSARTVADLSTNGAYNIFLPQEPQHHSQAISHATPSAIPTTPPTVPMGPSTPSNPTHALRAATSVRRIPS